MVGKYFTETSPLIGSESTLVKCTLLNVCPFDYTAVAVSGKVGRS